MTHKKSSSHNSRGLSRREFIKLAAMSGLLAGCGADESAVVMSTNEPTHPPRPTDPPVDKVPPTNTPRAMPTNTPAPTATLSPSTPTDSTPTTGVISFYPDVPSKVVHTHHAGVWAGDTLSVEAINQMLDASITNLTGLNDATEAWQALFKPTEKIAIKVNAFTNSLIWTHPPLVSAVTAKLQAAGIPAEQIFIYDSLSVFDDAGFQVNRDGPGVRCIAESDFSGEWQVADRATQLSDTLQNCDALINMPVLKSHMISGLTFALKNHFGSVARPSSLHSPIDQCIAELNALAPIKDRTRLVIGDVLEANLRFRNSWPYWEPDWRGDSILMSFDPVAHDTVGLEILDRLQAENEVSTTDYLRDKATSYLKLGMELGLGTNQADQMDVVDLKLG
jgi:hypothetical protein